MFPAWDQFAYQWQFLQLLNEERLKQQWISLHLEDIEGGVASLLGSWELKARDRRFNTCFAIKHLSIYFDFQQILKLHLN